MFTNGGEVVINAPEAEFLTLLKLSGKSIAELQWPYSWHYNPHKHYWTKPGLRYTQGGVVVNADYVLSDAYFGQLRRLAEADSE